MEHFRSDSPTGLDQLGESGSGTRQEEHPVQLPILHRHHGPWLPTQHAAAAASAAAHVASRASLSNASSAATTSSASHVTSWDVVRQPLLSDFFIDSCFSVLTLL